MRPAGENRLEVQRAKGPAASPLQLHPGDALEVTVTTTDPQGKPLPAELSLAMIEQSLLNRFPWPVPPIHEFFRGEPREPAMRTEASITFACEPQTRTVNLACSSEEDRAEIPRRRSGP